MAAGIASIFLSMLVMIPFFVIMGFIMLLLIRKKSKWQLVLAAGMIYCLAALFLFVSAEKKRTGHGMAAFLEAELTAGMDMAAERQAQAGISPADAERFKEIVRNFIIKPIYAWMFVSVGFTVLITYLFVSFYALRRYGIEQSMPQFETWRAGEPAAWLLIASLGILLFPKVITSETAQAAALNVLVVILNFYFLTGMAAISAVMTRFGAAPFLRYIFFAMVIFFSSLAVLIILTGILDTWFNFRHKNNGGGDEGNTKN